MLIVSATMKSKKLVEIVTPITPVALSAETRGETGPDFMRFRMEYFEEAQHLTALQRGIYFLALAHQWSQGHFSERDMSSIAGFGDLVLLLPKASRSLREEMESLTRDCLSPVLALFQRDVSGMLFHPRVDQDKREQLEARDRLKVRARKAASTRWAKASGKSSANGRV